MHHRWMIAHHVTPGPWAESRKPSLTKKDIYVGSGSKHKMTPWKGPSQSYAFYKTWPDETGLTYAFFFLFDPWNLSWTFFLSFSSFSQIRTCVEPFFCELRKWTIGTTMDYFLAYYGNSMGNLEYCHKGLLSVCFLCKCVNCPIPVN